MNAENKNGCKLEAYFLMGRPTYTNAVN